MLKYKLQIKFLNYGLSDSFKMVTEDYFKKQTVEPTRV